MATHQGYYHENWTNKSRPFLNPHEKPVNARDENNSNPNYRVTAAIIIIIINNNCQITSI